MDANPFGLLYTVCDKYSAQILVLGVIKPHTINITKPNELDIGIDYNSLIELYSNSK